MKPVVPLIAAIVSLVTPTSAAAYVHLEGIAKPQTSQLYRVWQAASQIPTANATLNIQERPCTLPDEPGSTACLLRFTPGRMTLVYEDPTWLWQDDGPTRPADRLAAQAVFYHELTHVRDYLPRKSRRYRRVFARIMGWRPLASLSRRERVVYDEKSLPDVYERWSVCVTLRDGSCVDPAEWFAMAGTWCSFNVRERPLAAWAAGYDYAPTAEQHRAACALLSRRLA